MNAPSVSTIKKLLDYDPSTGLFTWRERPREDYRFERSWKHFNRRFAGKAALKNTDTDGYRCGHILDTTFRAHRVAWAIHYGDWPDGQIDHINGDRTDNRIENLRCVSQSENKHNCKLYSNNKSGIPGVRFIDSQNRWLAKITVNREIIQLGSFVDFDAAEEARRLAEKQYGFHSNHGRRA